jgi:hypothetical protein
MRFRKVKKLFRNMWKDTNANLMDLGVEMTGFLVVIGLVMMPIGYTAISSLNKTTLGITAGSTQDTVLTSILTISLAVIVMALISKVGGKSGR